MDSINAALATVLQTMQTPGDFFAAGECALHLPLIEVEGVGPMALPLLPAQAAQLVAAAERAPYGFASAGSAGASEACQDSPRLAVVTSGAIPATPAFVPPRPLAADGRYGGLRLRARCAEPLVSPPWVAVLYPINLRRQCRVSSTFSGVSESGVHRS